MELVRLLLSQKIMKLSIEQEVKFHLMKLVKEKKIK